MRERIEFIGFIPDVTQPRASPGATIIGVAFEAPTAELANKGANELVSLVLQENVRLRTGRAGDTLEFFEARGRAAVGRARAPVPGDRRLQDRQRRGAARQPDRAPRPAAARAGAAARRSSARRRRCRNQRATVVWVFERTGRAAALVTLSPEEEELQALKSELIQQRAVYAPTSPTIRVLENRIAALEELVEEQRAARALPGEDGEAAAPLTELDDRAGADRRAAEVHRRGEGDDRGDARRARRLDPGDARPTRWCSAGSSASSRACRTSTTTRWRAAARPRSASASRCCRRASASR